MPNRECRPAQSDPDTRSPLGLDIGRHEPNAGLPLFCPTHLDFEVLRVGHYEGKAFPELKLFIGKQVAAIIREVGHMDTNPRPVGSVCHPRNTRGPAVALYPL